MKFFITFIGLMAVTLALPLQESHVQVEQDTDGHYKLDFNTDEASRTEQRFPDGHVVGTYSFIDADGIKHSVNYEAGAHEGFNVQSPDLPHQAHPVPETPEVIKARHEHLAAVEALRTL